MNFEDILEFIDAHWYDQAAFRSPEIASIFNVHRKMAHHYLMRTVYIGKLIRMSHKRNVWYILPEHYERFKAYECIGVELFYCKPKVNDDETSNSCRLRDSDQLAE